MKRISTRFAVLLALAGIVPLVAYGLVSVQSLRAVAKRQVGDSNEDLARRAGEHIYLYVRSSVRILSALATNLEQSSLPLWQKRQSLRDLVLSSPEFAELTLVDENGGVIVSSHPGPPSAQVPGENSIRIDRALMSPFTVDDDLLPTADIAIPLAAHRGGGWLLGRVHLEELWRMVDGIRIGDQGFAFVVMRSGEILAHGDPDKKAAVASNTDFSQHALVRQVQASGRPDAIISAEYEVDGTSMQGAAWTLPELQWTVVVEQPSSQAFAEADSQQKLLVAAIAVALFAMLAIGWFWGRSFINPIMRLTRGTRALAEGHLDERVVIDSKDELGQLGTAFNNMADRLVELQEDVKKKERQAIFGRVSVGLVHDLSTPIQNIGNSCKMMVMSFDDVGYRDTFKRTTERELAQIKRMLDDLRNIAKPVPLQKFPLDLNKALMELVESMHPTAESSGLTLETELCFGPLYIQGDLYALNRVYGNLIRNAFQATPPQGSVTVRTRREAEHAVVEIADTGAGIPAERLATIFDDFVTTKKRGLGLGLAISKRILEQLDGAITVASTVGRGTTFTMRFALTKTRPEQLAS